jgi:glutathione peroxidase
VGVYDHQIAPLIGGGDALASLRGKVTLVVNVASRCGLTPQYEGLQALHASLGGGDFSVLGVPCNQFLGQEPGTAEEIASFCSSTYGVDFPITEKVDVNGDGRHPLFADLCAAADADGHAGDVRWNFEKFLVGRDGSVLARFAPQTQPDDPAVRTAIDAALG